MLLPRLEGGLALFLERMVNGIGCSPWLVPFCWLRSLLRRRSVKQGKHMFAGSVRNESTWRADGTARYNTTIVCSQRSLDNVLRLALSRKATNGMALYGILERGSRLSALHSKRPFTHGAHSFITPIHLRPNFTSKSQHHTHCQM